MCSSKPEDSAGAVLGAAVAGDGDQAGAGGLRVAAEGQGHGVAVHAGQADVADDRVGMAALGLGDPVEPVDGDAHLVAVQPQEPAQALGGVGVVLDDQHAEVRRGVGGFGGLIGRRRGRRHGQGQPDGELRAMARPVAAGPYRCRRAGR